MGGTSDEQAGDVLRASLAAAAAVVAKLGELLATAEGLHATDAELRAKLLASAEALAVSQAQTREGQADLLTSTAALTQSRARTEEGKTDLLSSAAALAQSLERTEEGQADLLTSAAALAQSRARTEEGKADLRASAAELALSNSRLATGKADLQKSEERFRHIFEAAPSAMVMVNAAGRIEMVNVKTEQLFGYTRSQLLGAPLAMLVPARSHALHPQPTVHSPSPPTSRPMGPGRALFGLRQDGSEVEVEIETSPIETDEGMMVLSVIVDISERVRLETQVRHSLKMSAIGRVTAGVAHDFNNLLQALGGSLEMLLQIVADRPEAAEWGNIALRATARGRDLTERLLSFSGQQVLTARPVMVNTLFSELRKLINPLFETNLTGRTELVIVPCSPHLTVMADRAQLEAALINMAMNARDAMADGGCLRISAYEAEADRAIVPPGHYVVISVADTGSGMDANTLAQACEPFFTTKGVAGTGLGLSMVQGFARQSGGEAHIISGVGEGTTIDLWLPSAAAPVEAKPSVAVPPAAVGRILLVDDAPDALVVVSAFLRGVGLEVFSASSGDLALAALADGKRFTAIVSDFAMPGMNGMELLTLAREVDPSMVGMIITGYSEPELLSRKNDLVVLRKPFNRAELIKTVLKLISAKPVAARTSAATREHQSAEPGRP